MMISAPVVAHPQFVNVTPLVRRGGQDRPFSHIAHFEARLHDCRNIPCVGRL
ncbi:hypothetical protein [Komagataeibacter oboediens]|uniref:hypothetical protein n=1 Tax=Komagataeibacter oboediens TaxID=65958 RepID=UPI000237F185|nr:hypothetical protein [Komagataeibacter oboediens]